MVAARQYVVVHIHRIYNSKSPLVTSPNSCGVSLLLTPDIQPHGLFWKM